MKFVCTLTEIMCGNYIIEKPFFNKLRYVQIKLIYMCIKMLLEAWIKQIYRLQFSGVLHKRTM